MPSRVGPGARRREIGLAYLLLAPTVLLLAAVLGYPLGWEVWTSFTNLSPLQDHVAFVGLQNYRGQVEDPQFWLAATVTVVHAAVTTVAKLALGLGFALLLARPFRGRTLVFLAVFLPWAYPASVSVIGWYWTLSPPITTSYSVFMGTLKYAVDNALGTGAWVFLSVTLFNIWRGSSFIGVLLLAGINAVPPELFEYATLESKSAWQRFWMVTVPVPRVGRLPVAHQRLRRPRQCLDADQRADRLPGHRHPRLLARHRERGVRPRLGPLPDAGALPPRRAAVALPAVRSAGPGARVSPRGWRGRLGRQGLVLLVIVYCLFPIYFVLVQSLKTAEEDVFGNPLIVLHPTLENFEELFVSKGESRGFVGAVLHRSYPFFVWLENTIVVFTGTVVLTLGAAVAAAYALGRLRPPGFRWWRRVIFASYVIPQTILFVPLYHVVHALGLDDNLLVLVLVYPTTALPFCVWMLSAYFEHLPREIEEAALIEGASRATAFFRIILPLSRPVLVAAGIFTLGTIASDFTIASVFLLSDINQTIPAGLGTMEVALDELLAVAGINLMAIPIVLISACFARGYVRGLTAAMLEGA
jgi:ABC-type glycerol-3-phosphate transport system permease component